MRWEKKCDVGWWCMYNSFSYFYCVFYILFFSLYCFCSKRRRKKKGFCFDERWWFIFMRGNNWLTTKCTKVTKVPKTQSHLNETQKKRVIAKVNNFSLFKYNLKKLSKLINYRKNYLTCWCFSVYMNMSWTFHCLYFKIEARIL